jgi:RNA polymerase sigma-70 factor, ECF subfamily
MAAAGNGRQTDSDPLGPLNDALSRQDWAGATRLCLDALGHEICGFLVAYCRNPTLAGDAFAEFAEDLWRGLPTFRREGSLRAWAYVVARHAGDRQLRGKQRQARKAVPSGEFAAVDELVAHARETTRVYQQTGVKVQLRRLIETLPREDQLLLHLRLYSPEKLTWVDIAKILEGNEGGTDAEADVSAPARLRKRYARLIEKLKELARDDGLLD